MKRFNSEEIAKMADKLNEAFGMEVDLHLYEDRLEFVAGKVTGTIVKRPDRREARCTDTIFVYDDMTDEVRKSYVVAVKHTTMAQDGRRLVRYDLASSPTGYAVDSISDDAKWFFCRDEAEAYADVQRDSRRADSVDHWTKQRNILKESLRQAEENLRLAKKAAEDDSIDLSVLTDPYDPFLAADVGRTHLDPLVARKIIELVDKGSTLATIDDYLLNCDRVTQDERELIIEALNSEGV